MFEYWLTYLRFSWLQIEGNWHWCWSICWCKCW